MTIKFKVHDSSTVLSTHTQTHESHEDLPLKLWSYNGGFSCKSLSKLNNSFKEMLTAMNDQNQDIGGLLIMIHDTNTNSHTCDHSSRLGNWQWYNLMFWSSVVNYFRFRFIFYIFFSFIVIACFYLRLLSGYSQCWFLFVAMLRSGK